MKHIALAIALMSAAALTTPGSAGAFEIYGTQAAPVGGPFNLDAGPATYDDPIQYHSHDEGMNIGRLGNRYDYVGKALIPGPVSPGSPAWTYSLRGQ
jgi:hypothetical protein